MSDCECFHPDIRWNEYNSVYQCHKCGMIFVPVGED